MRLVSHSNSFYAVKNNQQSVGDLFITMVLALGAQSYKKQCDGLAIRSYAGVSSFYVELERAFFKPPRNEGIFAV